MSEDRESEIIHSGNAEVDGYAERLTRYLDAAAVAWCKENALPNGFAVDFDLDVRVLRPVKEEGQ